MPVLSQVLTFIIILDHSRSYLGFIASEVVQLHYLANERDGIIPTERDSFCYIFKLSRQKYCSAAGKDECQNKLCKQIVENKKRLVFVKTQNVSS